MYDSSHVVFVHLVFGFLLWLFVVRSIPIYIPAQCLSIYTTWLFSPLSSCVRSVVLTLQGVNSDRKMTRARREIGTQIDLQTRELAMRYTGIKQ